MSKLVSSSPVTGFDLESIEAWDLFRPDETLAEHLGINKLTLEIHFRSGKTRRVHGDVAQTIFNILDGMALPIYKESE